MYATKQLFLTRAASPWLVARQPHCGKTLCASWMWTQPVPCPRPHSCTETYVQQIVYIWEYTRFTFWLALIIMYMVLVKKNIA